MRLSRFLLLTLLAYAASALAQVPNDVVPNGVLPKDVEVLDRTVTIPNQNIKLRAVVTKPKAGGHYPAVLVVTGLGCYPLTRPQSDDPFTRFRYGLSERGFVTLWVEKNGEGASQGPACDSPQSDLQLAASRSVAGLEALAGYDFVDPKNIFIFAHSIGPLEAVLAAEKFHGLRGFIASETIGRSWAEYQLENQRRQMLLLGRPYDVVEKSVRTTAVCQYHFFVEKQSPDQIVKNDPECKEAVNTWGVSAAYLQQIAALDLAAQWKKIEVPVLVTWGTSDALTSADENRYLLDMINSFHPDLAGYQEFSGMGHALNLWPSQKAFLEGRGQKRPFDVEFLERIAAWLKENLNR